MCNWQETSWENTTLLLQGTIEKEPKKNSYCPNMIQLQQTSCHYTNRKLLPLDLKPVNWPEVTGYGLHCIFLWTPTSLYKCMLSLRGEAVIVSQHQVCNQCLMGRLPSWPSVLCLVARAQTRICVVSCFHPSHKSLEPWQRLIKMLQH